MRNRSLSISIIMLFMAAVFCCPSLVLARKGSGGEGKPGKKQLYSPIRLAITPGGNLLVSDYQQGMIVTMDCKTLEITRWFPVEGRPLGVAYANGHIYVGNASKECVEVYTNVGEKLYRLGSDDEPIKQPTDIAVDETQGYVFVVDGREKSVKVFHSNGDFIRTIPALNPNNEVLTNPTGIALDPVAREVLVSDYGDTTKSIWPRIQVFDYSGNLLTTISGKQGMFGMRFSRPQGLVVDESGQVFMVDCYSGEIQVLDRLSGSTLKILGGYGSDPGQLWLPLDIVIEPSSKDIYVTNNRCARIEIFKNGGVL